MSFSAQRSDEWNDMAAKIAAQVEVLKAKRNAAYEKLQSSLQALVDAANAEMQRRPVEEPSAHDGTPAAPTPTMNR